MIAESVAEQPLTPKMPFRFSRENARELAIKGNLARKRKREAELARLAQKDALADLEPEEKHRLRRVARTREHIERLDRMLARCNEPKDLKAIADALAKMEEVERVLSNRPLPGSRRPKAEKADKPANPTISDDFAPE